VIVGKPGVFAIESRISSWHEEVSRRALGLFVVYLNGLRYGVFEQNASFLACSFDEVGRRIAQRGQHVCDFASESHPATIAEAFSKALYADGEDANMFFGIPRPTFCELLSARDLLWAPDGDQAFDDGSYIIQFDIADRVRLIGFRREDNGAVNQATLRDVWLDANDYYEILQQWHQEFHKSWLLASARR
jgi:hypothetical protein